MVCTKLHSTVGSSKVLYKLGAYGQFEEHIKGSVEAKKLADFIVLDRDIFTCPTDEIKEIKVLRTVLGGETVYQSK